MFQSMRKLFKWHPLIGLLLLLSNVLSGNRFEQQIPFKWWIIIILWALGDNIGPGQAFRIHRCIDLIRRKLIINNFEAIFWLWRLSKSKCLSTTITKTWPTKLIFYVLCSNPVTVCCVLCVNMSIIKI